MRSFISIGAPARSLRRILVAAAVLFALAAPAAAQAPWPGLVGTWCWGSQWRSFGTPFLRIAHDRNGWTIQTKHYMHAYFVNRVKDVRFDGRYLSFTYWYEPRQRWAHCKFAAAASMMTGVCDGETRVGGWGPIASHIWREAGPRMETLNQ